MSEDDVTSMGKCPVCGAKIPLDATVCPECGEEFDMEDGTTREKSRLLIIGGIIVALIGGPGLALGSYIHDIMQIDIAGYDNFYSFGWANRFVATAGIIITIVGLLMIIIGLRGRKEIAGEPEEE